MTDDLMRYMVGAVTVVTRRGEGEANDADVVPVEVVEMTGDVIELAWTHGTKRHYLKLPLGNLRAAIEQEGRHDG